VKIIQKSLKNNNAQRNLLKMNKYILSISILISSTYSWSFCKINQYGHSLCKGERALLVVSTTKKASLAKNINLTEIYKPVTLRILHVHEPIAKYSKPGRRLGERLSYKFGLKKFQSVHVDQLIGNKACIDSNICVKQKVTINKECRMESDKPGKVYKVKMVYEDQEFVESIVEIERGFISKKRKILRESCLTLKD
jgi:hypothetical protein